MGLFELIHTQTPEHAAVSEAVECARRLHVNRKAVGFVNAVLRGFLRQKERLQTELEADPVATHAHPSWLLQRIQEEWPVDWPNIITANNHQAPMTLRIALDRIGKDQYLDRLLAEGIGARPHQRVASAIVLETPRAVGALPGFSEGLVSVQDAAAQLAAGLLDLQPGQRVLDACAAPGGKSGHILEFQPLLDELVAIDAKTERLVRLEDNLQRLGRRATVLEADLRETGRWWDGRPFDRILLDAPCTGSGVIRRHPDIKLLRRPEDSKTLAGTQRDLLSAAWSTLAPGGKIVYATCSLFGDENQEVINAFLAEHDEAENLCLSGQWGRSMSAGKQILPAEEDMDGFYYAGLRKRSA
jgi:16S rRNA (cytosine967-C5)-methyltransferase